MSKLSWARRVRTTVLYNEPYPDTTSSAGHGRLQTLKTHYGTFVMPDNHKMFSIWQVVAGKHTGSFYIIEYYGYNHPAYSIAKEKRQYNCKTIIEVMQELGKHNIPFNKMRKMYERSFEN